MSLDRNAVVVLLHKVASKIGFAPFVDWYKTYNVING